MSSVLLVTNDRMSVSRAVSMADKPARLARPKFGDKAPIINPLNRWSFGVSNAGIFKPDTLAKSGPARWKALDEMWRRDPLIRTYVNFLIDTMLSAPQSVKPNGTGPEAQRRADYCQMLMDSVSDNESGTATGWLDVCAKIVGDGLKRGVHIGEMVPDIRTDDAGDFPNAVYLSRYKPLHPKDFDFDQDEYGNLKPDGLVQYPKLMDQAIRHDPTYFVIYSHEGEFGNLWGSPLLETAYLGYFARDIFHRSLNVFVERYCLGILIGKHPEDWEEDEIADLLEHLRLMHGGTEMVFDKDVELELKDAPANGLMGLMKALEHYSTEIAIALRVPILLMNVGPSGSYALAQVQLRALEFVLRRWLKGLSEVIRAQIFKPYLTWGLGPGPVPFHEFGPLDTDVITSIAESYAALAGIGLKLTPEALAKRFQINPDDLAEPEPAPTFAPGVDPRFGGPNVRALPTIGAKKAPEKIAAAERGPKRELSRPERRMALAEMDRADEDAITNAARTIDDAARTHRRQFVARIMATEGEQGRPFVSTTLTSSHEQGAT